MFSVDYALTDYEGASDAIIHHAERNISYGVSALAVHGIIAHLGTPARLKEFRLSSFRFASIHLLEGDTRQAEVPRQAYSRRAETHFDLAQCRRRAMG